MSLLFFSHWWRVRRVLSTALRANLIGSGGSWLMHLAQSFAELPLNCLAISPLWQAVQLLSSSSELLLTSLPWRGHGHSGQGSQITFALLPLSLIHSLSPSLPLYIHLVPYFHKVLNKTLSQHRNSTCSIVFISKPALQEDNDSLYIQHLDTLLRTKSLLFVDLSCP